MSENTKPIADNLWNQGISPEKYGSKEQYFEHTLEQYKITVEMADRVSARRNLVNTFFLTLHTLLIGTASFIFEKGPRTSNPWSNIFPLAALLALCYVWWRLLRSYRQLNKAKYQVIGEFERKLPASPYWNAEWKLLKEGKDPAVYKPLTDVENWVPIIFGFLYIIGALAVIFSS
jgi:hypothetical protein